MFSYILNEIYEQYRKIWDLRDIRLNHLPCMDSPLLMIILIFGYLRMIQSGRKFMEHRQPMEINGLIMLYNFIQILASSLPILVIIFYIFVVNPKFSVSCEPNNFSSDPMPLFEAYLSYFYFLLKLSHLLDTVFFILRKKWSQISFLHVYHHVMVLISSYIGILYAPGGHSILFGLLNCIENSVMYTYYFISSCKPMGITPSITMKKNVVRLQIAIFYLMTIHFGHVLVIPGHSCDYNKYVCILGAIQAPIMAALYTAFYRSAYGQKKEQRKIE